MHPGSTIRDSHIPGPQVRHYLPSKERDYSNSCVCVCSRPISDWTKGVYQRERSALKGKLFGRRRGGVRVPRQQKDLRRRCGKVERKGRTRERIKEQFFPLRTAPFLGKPRSYGNLNCSPVPHTRVERLRQDVSRLGRLKPSSSQVMFASHDIIV